MEVLQDQLHSYSDVYYIDNTRGMCITTLTNTHHVEPSKEPPEHRNRRCSNTEKPCAISLLGA